MYLQQILIGTPSSSVLLGAEAKKAILQYIEMQKENPQNNNLFERNKTDSQWRLSSILEYLDESLLLDIDFKKQLLDLAIEKGYRITLYSPAYLKQNSILAENYYRDLLENNDVDKLLNANILSPELLKNQSFLQNYINILSQKGIDNETIVSTLTHNEKCINVFKTNIELFQSVFEQIEPSNLEKFFDKFFSDTEVKEILTNQNQLSGKLLQLSRLYDKDSTTLQSLNGKLLGEQYQDIPNYKMQLIAKNPEFQSKILGLTDYEYSLYSKITEFVAKKTNRWNRFEQNVVENLSEGYYGDLISDLYEQAKEGNKITAQDIETLALLFSSKCSLSRLYMEQYWQDKGKDEESIKQNLFSTSNNIFNITNKKELEHFRDIKELICDTVLTNTSLDDMELTKPINKYLQKFYQLSELDRTKLALLEKYYNIDLKEAEKIVQNFSYDINNLSSDNEYHAGIVEQIKAIKNIFESNDIKTLQQVAGLDILVETDLSVSTFLIEQSREMFEQIYKGSLYEPKQENKIEPITFNGKKIDVFDANKEFSMIVKRITVKDNNSQEIWNSMTKEGEYGRNDLRYNTCASYMTDENLLELLSDREVILGFGNGTKDYSFDAIYTSDAHTPFYGGDRIYNDLDSTYMLPTTLETNTDNNYNEIVINTLGVDEQGQMTKLQPDYVIYIKDQNKSENMEKDPVWINSKKVASEFGIPIVMVDKEKIKETERTKIANIATTLSEIPKPDVALKFVKKIEHYINRYGIESIQEFVSNDKMNFLRNYIEQKKSEEKDNISIPNIEVTAMTNEQTNDNRQEILKKQNKLKENNIITGEER